MPDPDQISENVWCLFLLFMCLRNNLQTSIFLLCSYEFFIYEIFIHGHVLYEHTKHRHFTQERLLFFFKQSIPIALQSSLLESGHG